MADSQEVDLLAASPTTQELEQEISESQAAHQKLLDYSVQDNSLILPEAEKMSWSQEQKAILDENHYYFKTCADIIKRIADAGPAESKHVPAFPSPPKRKMSSLYGDKPKKQKMTLEELHQYLIRNQVDVSKTVRKEVFEFSPEEIKTTNFAIEKLQEGYRQIQRHDATSMCFNLQYGALLDVAFELHAKEKDSGVQTIKWDDWLKKYVGISSSYSRKMRVISRLLKPYVVRFSSVGLPFIEIYSLRKELKDMLSSSEEIRQFWAAPVQPGIQVVTQNSQE